MTVDDPLSSIKSSEGVYMLVYVKGIFERRGLGMKGVTCYIQPAEVLYRV